MDCHAEPGYVEQAGGEECEFRVADSDCNLSALHEESPRGPYDLGERTASFGEAVIRFAVKIPFNPVNNRLIDQLVGAATSVGANYCEADDGLSQKDFRHRIGTCRKEAKETMYWLRMIVTARPDLKAEARILWKEARELNRIFGSIWRKSAE